METTAAAKPPGQQARLHQRSADSRQAPQTFPGSTGLTGTWLKRVCPLPPAAVSCRTQPQPQTRQRMGTSHRAPACAPRQARGCGGSRIRISCTCAFPSPVVRPLGLRVTHAQSGGRLGTSPTGWTDRGCSAPHPRGSPLTSLVSSLRITAQESQTLTVPSPPC